MRLNPFWRRAAILAAGALASSAALAGDFKTALAIQDKLVPLQVATFLEAGVTGAKYGLSLLGKVGEEVRLPLVPSTQATKDRIRAAMVFAGLLEA